MRLRKSSAFVLILCSLTLSSIIVGAKTSYSIWADSGLYNYQSFFVGKSNLSIKLRIKVTEGGPVSVYIMDERFFPDWDEFGASAEAYIGASNITGTITLAGYLGPKIYQIDNETSFDMTYYLIIDNRENSDYGSYVNIDFIQTLPSSSVFLSFLALLPLALLISRKRKA
jgi:hypothetical protein